MTEQLPTVNPRCVASEFDAEVRALPVRNIPNVRKISRRYARRLKDHPPDFVLAVVHTLVQDYGYRGPAYELLAGHRAAFQSMDEIEIEALGRGIDSWNAVDEFARALSGPAWLRDQIPDAVITRWAHSDDLWWRRAALVSTVALNMRSHGGPGDAPRTLAVCRLLADEREDMVVKALSWALRELVVHDSRAVSAFLQEHDAVLAARVKREVRNKLTTGLKNPRSSRND